jgi:hypothetical protein
VSDSLAVWNTATTPCLPSQRFTLESAAARSASCVLHQKARHEKYSENAFESRTSAGDECKDRCQHGKLTSRNHLDSDCAMNQVNFLRARVVSVSICVCVCVCVCVCAALKKIAHLSQVTTGCTPGRVETCGGQRQMHQPMENERQGYETVRLMTRRVGLGAQMATWPGR